MAKSHICAAARPLPACGRGPDHRPAMIRVRRRLLNESSRDLSSRSFQSNKLQRTIEVSKGGFMERRTFDRSQDVSKLEGCNTRGIEYRWDLFTRELQRIPRGAAALDF